MRADTYMYTCTYAHICIYCVCVYACMNVYAYVHPQSESWDETMMNLFIYVSIHVYVCTHD